MQAISSWTTGRAPFAIEVPLSVEVVGHVDDVVDDVTDLVDWELLEIPI